jgi:peptidoglycan/LPS O-acetylase OafA/YrhL
MRHQGLDLLPSFTILLVLLRHLWIPQELQEGWEWLWFLKRGGWIGVDIFFVLSGFLVSGLLFQEIRQTGRANTQRFLIRRAFKIYPQFWLLILYTIAAGAISQRTIPLRSLLGELFFLQNYIGKVWNHTWSLAVEEHFYFGIAFLVSCLVKCRGSAGIRYIPLAFWVVAGGSLALRLAADRSISGIEHTWLCYKSHFRIDSLLFGVFLAYFWYFGKLRESIMGLGGVTIWVIRTAGFVCLLPAFIWEFELNRIQFTYGLTLFYVGAGLILISVLPHQRISNSYVRNAAGLGAASYPVYLWHMSVNSWTNSLVQIGTENVELRFITYGILYICSSFVFGFIMFRLIDSPSLRIRDKLFPRGAAVVTSPETASLVFTDPRSHDQ